MKTGFFSKTISVLLAALLLLPLSSGAWAETGPTAGGAGTTTFVSEWRNGLRGIVEYPMELRCGQPVTFAVRGETDATLHSEGFGYMRGFVEMLVDGKRDLVLDGAAFGNSIDTIGSYEFTFFAPGTYYFSFDVYNNSGTNSLGNPTYSTRVPVRFTVTVPATDPDYPSLEAIVEDLKNQCLAQCTTDYEKALWCHDWILNKCRYDYNFYYCGPEGALARGIGTCEAYHRAYVLLLNAVGLETGRMEGNGHVWTAVKMDGEWYQVDLTWDAATYARDTAKTEDDYELHMYFGLTDEIMTAAHNEHKPEVGYESNSLKNNYYIRSGDAAAWAAPFLPDIQKKLNGGGESFSLPIPQTTAGSPYRVATAYYKYVYSVVAYYLSTLDWSAYVGTGDRLRVSFDGSSALSFSVERHAHQDATAVTKQPTCTEPGTQVRTCTVCGRQETGELAALGHSWSGYTVNTEATYSAPGSRSARCVRCGEVKTETIPKKENPFVDVTGDYYYAPVLWALDRNVTAGVDENHFSPGSLCTRGQVVSFLWRAAGRPTPRAVASPFRDVQDINAYYYQAVLWAWENGIVAGTGAEEFSPNDQVTRAQFVTFLWRLAKKPTGGEGETFSDVAPGTYYTGAVLWANAKGIAYGVGGGKFDPFGNCTRGQTVSFLYRYYSKVA